jgi:porin
MYSKQQTTRPISTICGSYLYRCIYTVFFILLIVTCTTAQNTPADPDTPTDPDGGSFPPNLQSSWNDRNYMFGDWGGTRSQLAQEGVTFDVYYVSDFLGNPIGGRDQAFTSWQRVRGTVDIDIGELTGTNAPKFHMTGVWQNGGNLGATYLGSIANPSSLVSEPTFRLDSWWFQQALFHKHLFLKGGQFAGLDFYGNQEYGWSYLMEPLGYALGNLFTTTYESFDPAATPAAEVMVVPNKHVYVKSAILAGNRNPYADDVTGFGFVRKNTPVVVSEIGYLTNSPDLKATSSSKKLYPGKYKVGSSYNIGDFVDPVTRATRSGNYLIYFMANQAVYRPEVGSNRGLDLDFAIDWSPDQVNRVNEQITGGFRYNGPIPHREKDALAVGVVYSKVSDHFDESYLLHNLPTYGAEHAFELNYMIQVTPWLILQPAVQYYADLGAATHSGDGVAAGFRLKVTF